MAVTRRGKKKNDDVVDEEKVEDLMDFDEETEPPQVIRARNRGSGK